MFKVVSDNTGLSVAKIKTVTALLALIAASGAAYAVAEPYLPAHRGYVRSEAQKQVEEHSAKDNKAFDKLYKAQSEVQINIAESRKAVTEKELFDWQIKLPEINDPQFKQMVQERVRSLNDLRERLEEHLKTLRAKSDP